MGAALLGTVGYLGEQAHLSLGEWHRNKLAEVMQRRGVSAADADDGGVAADTNMLTSSGAPAVRPAHRVPMAGEAHNSRRRAIADSMATDRAAGGAALPDDNVSSVSDADVAARDAERRAAAGAERRALANAPSFLDRMPSWFPVKRVDDEKGV